MPERLLRGIVFEAMAKTVDVISAVAFLVEPDQMRPPGAFRA